MAQLVLLAWVWVISGVVALYIHSDELAEDTDALTAVLLVFAWPWLLIQCHCIKKEREEQKKLVPIRIETKDRAPKGR